MGLKFKANPKQFRKRAITFFSALEESVLQKLKEAGTDCVTYARKLNTYKNRTGNLRNSVGFLIVYKGKIVHEDFRRSAVVYKDVIDKNGKRRKVKTKGSEDGVKIGRDKAREMAKNAPTGEVFYLVFVAGMNYAVFVEAKGYDVISTARAKMIRHFERLKRQYDKKKGGR